MFTHVHLFSYMFCIFSYMIIHFCIVCRYMYVSVTTSIDHAVVSSFFIHINVCPCVFIHFHAFAHIALHVCVLSLYFNQKSYDAYENATSSYILIFLIYFHRLSKSFVGFRTVYYIVACVFCSHIQT